MSSPQFDRKIKAVRESGLSIYDCLNQRPDLFFEIHELELALSEGLEGLNLARLPNRTRSKVFKCAVCKALGYSPPASFRKTRPRFPGQDFDTYVQKADNLQIWNEDVSPTRRYVIARPDGNGIIRAVRVVTGESIAELDKKGTLTKKYQARRKAGRDRPSLISSCDTPRFTTEFSPTDKADLSNTSPTDKPIKGKVLSVKAVYRRLKELLGTEISNPGYDQERNRGAGLQRAVCQVLGLSEYADTGQWPDILSQALEVKLQTAATIDLGLISPDSSAAAQEVGASIRHSDVRYAVFYGTHGNKGTVSLDSLVVTTGQDFFTEFDKFGGKIINAKLQIRLPAQFFSKPK